MDLRPPLHLHLLAHPRSLDATTLAAALMCRFVEPPASGGLRIPVFFTPEREDDLPPEVDLPHGLQLDTAQHSIVVVLADERMLRTVPHGTGDEWIAFVRGVVAHAPLGTSPHHVLPVALEQDGFAIANKLHVLPALLDPRIDRRTAQDRRLATVSFHIAARAIQLLEHGKIAATEPDRMKAPVTIFLSHAKADLDQQHHEDPVRQTRAELNELPVEQWFDAQQIATSQDFADAISAGIRDCSIMLAFQTDHYSSRPWCRREVLDAKRLGAHLLIVDAVQSGEPRSFPYAGNVPTVRWQYNADSRLDAQRVIDRAVREALRLKHNRAVLAGVAQAGDILLPAAPEALTLAFEDEGTVERSFLYPDPPLGREELQVLQRLRPKTRFVTPLTRLARWPRPPHIETISVSISPSEDVAKYGLSNAHFATLSDEIHLYLLLAGLKIAYGGALKGDFTAESNFALRLFELVRSYSKLAESVDATPLKKAVLNVAPWPLRLAYGDTEWKLFAGEVARYAEGLRPDLPWSDDQVFPPADNGRVLTSDTPQRRYAWARGLGAMRAQITDLSQARLVIGGKLTGYSGLVPGIVEEAWLSMTRQKPLFLLGGFGGAARLVCDQLLGIVRQEFSEAWSRQRVPDYEPTVALYGDDGGNLHTMAKIAEELATRVQPGLAQALRNGLDDAENRDLMACTDPQRVATLVLTGLGRL